MSKQEDIKTGVKYDDGKLQWRLIPWDSLKEVVAVLSYGSTKYAPDNWKYVGDAKDRYSDAALRHFTSWLSGERNDEETGKSHLAHCICCLLFLIWFDKEEENTSGRD